MSVETTPVATMLDPRDPRYRPEPRVIRLPQWRGWPGEKPELFLERREEWRVVHPIFIASLEALRDGGGFEEAVRRSIPLGGVLNEKHIRIYLRRHFLQLANDGHLEIPLPPAPEVFHDRYVRVKEIGRGGVGIAHLCQDKRTGANVVVKHAWGWLAPIDRADKTMREEDEALKAFDHPGIPRRIEGFERDGLLHIARDYVEGEPIAARISRERPPPRAERLRLLLAVAGIVEHMHGRGYLFLDPTPNNFILRPDGQVVVIDVGICRRHENGRALRQGQAGSRGYAAPEVVARENIGVWSDVFSIACLHYFLATGKQSGHTWTPAERAEHVAKLDVPEDERSLMLACWSADPAARPTMAEVVAALR